MQCPISVSENFCLFLKGKKENRPWWPSGLERASNSSRFSLEGSGLNPAWGIAAVSYFSVHMFRICHIWSWGRRDRFGYRFYKVESCWSGFGSWLVGERGGVDVGVTFLALS